MRGPNWFGSIEIIYPLINSPEGCASPFPAAVPSSARAVDVDHSDRGDNRIEAKAPIHRKDERGGAEELEEAAETADA